MSWTEFHLREVTKQLKQQKSQIAALISDKADEKTIQAMCKELYDYIDLEKESLLKHADIEFSDEYDLCRITFDGWIGIDITDPKTLGDLVEVVEKGETLNKYDFEWLAPSDSEIIGNIPLEPDEGLRTIVSGW